MGMGGRGERMDEVVDGGVCEWMDGWMGGDGWWDVMDACDRIRFGASLF